MPEGGPLDYAHWRMRYWIAATKAIGLPWLTFHDLRRANATALVSAGVDLKTAQTRLGHSDPRLSLAVYAAVYAQATTAADCDAADRVAALLMKRAGAASATGNDARQTEAARMCHKCVKESVGAVATSSLTSL